MTTTINSRYLLHEKLGQGGMGVVYRATDRLTGDIVALKQVNLVTQADPFSSAPLDHTNDNLRLALAHEFQMLATLRHPNIISVLDYGFDDRQGRPFFTMSYLPEANEIISAAATLDTSARLNLLRQTLQALVYLHRRGILHRDLKPGNVLVSGDNLRVLDFGLAAAKEEATLSVGTWAYSAPEVLEEYPATEASDLYSLGIIAYQIFAGRHPFDLKAPDFIDQVLDMPPDLSRLKVDEPVARVIGRLLEKRPADRLGSAAAAVAALSEASGQPLPVEDVDIRESFLQAATFVGRRREMRRLTDAAASAADGRGQAYLIGGESGVGKSRLLNEIRIHALVEGALVLRGQSVEDSGGAPYQLWRDAIRRLVITVEVDDLSAGVLQAILPDIEVLLDRPVPEVPVLEGQAGRQRLISTIISLFRRSAQWILLLLEDLHWSTENLDVLQQLTRQTEQLPLLIIGTYRNDERPELPDLLPRMSPLELQRLAEEEITALSVSMLGRAGQQPRVLELLRRETEGNAFFLVEVVRELAEKAGRLSAIGNMALPEQVFPRGIETIVQRRLARIPPDSRELLPGAATVGRQLDLQLLQHLAPRYTDIADLEAWLTVCADAAVLDVYDDVWRFTHEKLREGLLNTLPDRERVLWHERVALGIETLYPDNPEYAATLTYHWGKVGDREKERAYAQIAGQYARRQFLNREAVLHLSRALELTPPDAPVERFELLLAREEVLNLQGKRQEQEKDLQALERIGDQLHELEIDERRAEVALRLSRFAEATGNYNRAVSAAERAIELGSFADEPLSMAQGYIAWGRVLLRLGELSAAQEKFELARDHAERGWLFGTVADTLRWMGVAATDQGDFLAADEYYREALPIYRHLGMRHGESSALNNLGNINRAQGNYGAALESWEAARRIFQEIGDREGTGRVLINLAAVWLDLADYEQARQYSEPALRILREIGHPLGECFALVNLGLLHFYEQEHDTAERYSRDALTLAEEIGARFLRGLALMTLGHTLAAQNRFDESRQAYREALSLWQSIEHHALVMSARAGLAAAWLESGELAKAQAEVEQVLDGIAAGHALEGIERPSRVYLTLYQVLALLSDPRAGEILTAGYQQLQARAADIANPDQRRSFLEADVRRRLVEAYEAHTGR